MRKFWRDGFISYSGWMDELGFVDEIQLAKNSFTLFNYQFFTQGD